MLASITIRGIGPRTRTHDLSPEVVTIREPSAAGKTSIIRAFLCLLTGKDIDGRPLSNATSWPVEVEALTLRGNKAKRTIEKDGSVTRKVGEDKYDTEKAWADKVRGPADPIRARLVLVPLAWREMEAAVLRDVLVADPSIRLDSAAAVRRAVDLSVASIVRASPHWREGDPDALGPIEEARRKAGQLAQRALGALGEAEKEPARLVAVDAPPEAEVQSASYLLRADTEWCGYRAAQRRYREWLDYREKVEALGERPAKPPPTTLEEARALVESVRGRVRNMDSALLGAATAVSFARQAADAGPAHSTEVVELALAVERAQQALDAASEPPEVCPSCGQTWPESIVQRRAGDRERAGEALDAAFAALEAAVERDRAASEAEKTRLAELLATAEAEHTAVRDRADAARVSLREAEEAYDRLAIQVRIWADWGDKKSSLVVAPEVPKPTRPDADPLEPGQLEAANAVIDRHRRAQSQGDLLDVQRKAAALRIEECRAALSKATAERERLDGLVDDARQAPAALLPSVLGGMGDLDPLSIVGTDSGIEVLYMGRPWHALSNGERTVADALFRYHLRARFGLGMLPIFVDNAQDWSGDWPPLGRCVFLYTEKEAP